MVEDSIKNYIPMMFENKTILDHIEELKCLEQIPAVEKGDGSKHTGSAGDSTARRIERRLDYESKAAATLKANTKAMKDAEAAVNRISDPTRRSVVRLRYLTPAIDNATGLPCNRRLTVRQVALEVYGNEEAYALKCVNRLQKLNDLNC